MPLRGAVLVANHRCSLDPFFIQLAAGRRVHWMVASEYFKHPLFGAVLRLFQAIPTTRSGADNQATKHAVRLASEGRLVGMFPEGRLNRTRQHLISMRPGAILVANKANVPIVPLWIRGAPIADEVWKPVMMPAAVLVNISQPAPVEKLPIDLNRAEQSTWLADEILGARIVEHTSL
jgi:1-acyl-sn-glycerol-3-phosphate acyltransferase